MKRAALAVSFLSGLVFAVGLGFSGMTQPSKILAFLDFTGDWDPSLLLVMGSAIGVHLWFARRAMRANEAGERPVFAGAFHLPTATRIDGRLLGGAALFGVGWGLSGYCPGPVLVSLVRLAPSTLAFFATMVAGLLNRLALFGAMRAAPYAWLPADVRS